MKKLFLALLTQLGFVSSQTIFAQTSIYTLHYTNIVGKEETFEQYKGKKILIVNTASKCGYTKQYKQLEELFEKYKDKLVIIGFPCNQFLGQEPGSNSDILEFCQKNYNVSFPLSEKIDVKGSKISPIYAWLTEKKQNGVLDAKISWNFNKFLLDENGYLLEYFGSAVEPLSPEIIKYLK
ncbi:MAG: glutathione peroxidase [Sediminibacterium sp.]|nr:glutathione peroxidase [Sediminibacterium sp.]